MKKYIIAVSFTILFLFTISFLFYRLGFYVDIDKDAPVTSFMKTSETKILMLNPKTGAYEPFEIRGVNMGSGQPGHFSTDFSIKKDVYLRWFEQIQEMGANTIRIYTVQSPDFYEAFYEFNSNQETPLYLIHGVWVNDYILNSHMDSYDKQFFDEFKKNCKTMVDVIHGKRNVSLGRKASMASGSFRYDISPWVIGYILGVEWEDLTVAYTDNLYEGDPRYEDYQGQYLTTTEDATAFECMLARVGDDVIKYETNRYKQQRLLAFANWNTTDPFPWDDYVQILFLKCASVDVEHIKATEEFLAGQFASYHSYPYYPDYLYYESDWSKWNLNPADFIDEAGRLNSYRAYLSMLNRHHTIPVLISEFGVSTGRGIAQKDQNTGRHQGFMSEREQGDALVACWEDIKATGSAGGCIFSWQDEWFKRTWNTMHAVDLTRTPYWSDYQTNEQYFGLLSYDPGKKRSVCYVDGDVSEWKETDVLMKDGELTLSVKYDERFVYLLIHKPGLSFEEETLYLPIDTTPKSGSSYCDNFQIAFDRGTDFLLVIHGKNDSRLLVQERYEALRANYAQNVYGYDTYLKNMVPEINSPKFVDVNMILQLQDVERGTLNQLAAVFPTGKLTYGNANPEAEDFNSLADFICQGDDIEIKLPWQLLNYADPSKMQIHDDYYSGHYGIKFIKIDQMYLGLGHEGKRKSSLTTPRIHLTPLEMKGWKNKVTYHERLKSSYYTMQRLWTQNEERDKTNER